MFSNRIENKKLFDLGFDVNGNRRFEKKRVSFHDIENDIFKPADNADVTREKQAIRAVVASDGSGDFTDIQEAINFVYNNYGGGRVFLRNGTYNVFANIYLYPNIYIEGQNAESTIIDFNNTSSGFVISGIDEYSTGTVAVTNGSTTITGTGTTFTSAMVGQAILLKGLWYPIVGYTSTTVITIAAPYAGETITGFGCVIASPIIDVYIEKLFIKRSLSAALYFKNTFESIIQDLNIQECAVAISMENVSNLHLEAADIGYNAYGLTATNINYCLLISSGSVNTTVGDNFSFTNCFTVSVTSCFTGDATLNGVSVTNCVDMFFNGIQNVANTGNGMELKDGNENVAMIGCGARSSGGDGIKFTANNERCIVSASVLTNNGGYGVNIANANNSNNVVKSNCYSGNTTAAVQDLGTDTNSSTY